MVLLSSPLYSDVVNTEEIIQPLGKSGYQLAFRSVFCSFLFYVDKCPWGQGLGKEFSWGTALMVMEALANGRLDKLLPLGTLTRYLPVPMG